MVDTPRTFRCPPDHKHAVKATCWGNHGCRCDECREAHRRRIGGRRKQIAYGRWEGLIPADEACARVRLLVDMGWNRGELRRVAGLNRATFDRIRHGETRYVQPRIHHAIMSIPIQVPEVNIRGLVDGEGTARRLQALAVMGWSGVEIAKHLNRHPSYVRKLMTAMWVQKRTREDVARVYDELWDKKPPLSTPQQRSVASRTAKLAAANGWAGPLHWDDIDTDPEPATTENPRTGRELGWVIDELEHFRLAGESPHVALGALRRDPGATVKLAYRHGRPDLGRWLEEAA